MGVRVWHGCNLATTQRAVTLLHEEIGLHIQVAREPMPGIDATVLIGRGGPVILVAADVAGTIRQDAAVSWALEQINAGRAGWHVLLAGC